MSASPISRAISDDSSNPTLYMFACALCRKKMFSEIKRDVLRDREEHELTTGHDVSFVRSPMKRSKVQP